MQLEPFIRERLTNERQFAARLLNNADRDARLRVSPLFAAEVADTEESIDFAINYACDGEPAGRLRMLGFDYSLSRFGSPVQKLATRVQFLDAILGYRHQVSESTSHVFRDSDDGHLFQFFVSHASEDREQFVSLLVAELVKRRLRVHPLSIGFGEDLTKAIDHGIAQSRFGIIILSPAYMLKTWTQRELRGFIARETIENRRVILPVLHGVTERELARFSPTLAGQVYCDSRSMTISEIANDVESFATSHG